MTPLIVVAALAAGALGALVRYGVTHAFRLSPQRLPWAVLLVNLLGSFIAGIVVGVSSLDPDGVVRLIALGGFAGGLTTFSTFSVESVQLALEGRWRAVVGSVLGNALGGIAAFILGCCAITAVLGPELLHTG
jgi:fluoride exporter